MKNKHKKIAYIKSFSILFLLTMTIFIFNFSKAKAAPDTTLYFNPSSSSVAVDGDFTSNAMIDPGTNAVSAVTLHFTFDQTILRLDSITPSATFSIVLADAVINNTNGTASIDVAVPYSSPSITSASTMITLNFHSLSSATNSSIAYTTASQAAADGESGNVVVGRTGSLITITGTDTTPPILSEITPIATPTSDTTPSYIFNSSEAGAITYGGSCSSNDTSAVSGNNTITFFTLASGTYSDCTITVTDTSGNTSNFLNVAEFVVSASSYCGDGYCNSGESYLTCESDCSGEEITLSPEEDTFINLNIENNYSSSQLNTYTWPTNQIANAILMKFNLDSLSQDITVESAQLSLYQTEAGGDTTYTLTVHRLINFDPDLTQATGHTYDGINSWSPYTGLYNDVPLAQADIETAISSNDVGLSLGTKTLDITDMVNEWMSGAPNYGLMINSDPIASLDSYRYFASSENANTAWRPSLIITEASTCTSGETISCATGLLGACSTGTETCINGSWSGVCSQNNSATTEICGDGIDQDCDGSDLSCDTTSPVISNVAVSYFDESSATIGWTTDEPTIGRVDFGLTTSYGRSSSVDSLNTSHSITISGLSDNTIYHYRVYSVDQAGNESFFIDRTFETEASVIPDTTAPATISDLEADNITQTSADISWTAPGDDGDIGTASLYDIRYSTSVISEANWSLASQLSGEPDPAEGGTIEELYISIGLQANTTYYYAIKTIDESNNISPISNILAITTLPETAPTCSGFTYGDWGECQSNNTQTRSVISRSPTGCVGGTPNSQRSCEYDSGGGSSSSGSGSGSSGNSSATSNTNPSNAGGGGEQQDITPPNAPANFTAHSANNQIRLTWENPSDLDFVRVKVLRKTGSTISGINDLEAEVIYEGRAQEYTDAELDNQIKYHYAIFAFDKKPNYSKLVILDAQPEANKEYIAQPKKQQQIKLNDLYNQPHEIVEQVSSSEANTIYSYNKFVSLDESTLSVYQKLARERNVGDLGEDNKYSIAYFIHYGTPTTLRLGAGERAGVINSFWEAFKKAPITVADWQDVIKIANGRWPKQTNASKEDLAKQKDFLKIYQKSPNMDNPNENAAVTIITYGLRPVNRNMESEKQAIKTFKYIYGYNPTSASDWDIVRAVAYSGASR